MPLGMEVGLGPGNIVQVCYQTVVCLSVLSVTLVYYGQTVGWTKVKLGMQAGLGPGHIVGHSCPQFLAHTSCGQMAEWIKMPQGRPRPRQLCRDLAAPPQKGGGAPSPIFGPSLLWPNGWMNQDGTWQGGGPCPGHIVLDGDPVPLLEKGGRAPNFPPISIVAKWLDASRCHLVWR